MVPRRWYCRGGGEAEIVKQNLEETVRQEGEKVRLELEGKSEVLCADPVIRDSVLNVLMCFREPRW